MKYNLPDRVLREIKFFAKKYNIEKVILFGSRAKGTHTERSDIDLAVSGGDITNFGFDVDELTHTLLMFDIVNLDRGISEELQKEIDRDGVVIYEKV